MTLLLPTVASYAHKQHVHQYLVKEAYELLKQRNGGDIAKMQDHIGGLEEFYAGDFAWQRSYVTTGAWREDDEDVIFGYSNYSGSGIKDYALISITHFWDADQGDSTQNYFRIQPVSFLDSYEIGPYENTYNKIMRFVKGGWSVKYPSLMIVQNTSNGHELIIRPSVFAGKGVPVSYKVLTDFFLTRHLNLDSSGLFTVFDVTANEFINAASVPDIYVPESEPAVENIVWEVLGRMCHLLQDMSVPAHAHRDEHGLDLDPYEEWIGGEEHPYLVWDHQNVGEMIDPYTPDNDPVHYLMYTMQAQSDHFGSFGSYEGDGNDDVGGDVRRAESAFLGPSLFMSLGEPTGMEGPWTESNFENMRDKLIPYAIRATAGLLYWFAVETGLTAPVSVKPAYTGSMHGGFSLFQNYPNPFNPSTRIKFQIPNSGYVSLRVYDILGREVATLVNGQLSAGEHETEFSGKSLPGGVYFYRLFVPTDSRKGKAGTFSITRKFTLLK